jgi:hypothetical protein
MMGTVDLLVPSSVAARLASGSDLEGATAGKPDCDRDEGAPQSFNYRS